MSETRRLSRVLAGVGAVAVAIGASCFLIANAHRSANPTPTEMIGPPAPAAQSQPEALPENDASSPAGVFLSTSKSLTITPANDATVVPAKGFLNSSKSAAPRSLPIGQEQKPKPLAPEAFLRSSKSAMPPSLPKPVKNDESKQASKK